MSTHDNRHPQYDDATIQAAFEEACNGIAKEYPKLGKLLTLAHYNGSGWTEDSPARLALAKAFLAHLIAAAREQGEAVGINGLTTSEEAGTASVTGLINLESAVGATPGSFDLREALAIADRSADEQMRYKREAEARAKKAEAELADLRKDNAHLRAACDIFQDGGLSRLRPLPEAGPVPAGCVRLYFAHINGEWSPGIPQKCQGDTHYADILLPEASQPDSKTFPAACLKPVAKEGQP